MADPLIGKQLGDYVIQELLGRGGMARVYKGYDERLQRHAAVKVINSEFAATADQAEYTERFRREARAIARLHHPNIVGVYQFGDYEGNYYMAMVFVEGQDLRQILKDRAERGEIMPYADILNIVRGIGGGLDYAHSRGVIHRDIKPSNIMLDSENHAVLTDFGLALSIQEGTLGDTFGSAHYIAPEQAVSSAKAVPQSDLYSLGICTYEMLTGKVPFDDPSAMSVALKHLNDAPPPPHLYNPDLTPEIEKVIFKILDKDPNNRYPTGAAFAQALEQAVYADASESTAILPTGSRSAAPTKVQAAPTAQTPKPPTPPSKPPTPPAKPSKKQPEPTAQSEATTQANTADYSSLVALAEQFNAGQKVVGVDDKKGEGKRSVLPFVAGLAVLLVLTAAGLYYGGAFNRGGTQTPTTAATTAATTTTADATSVAVVDPTEEATAEPTNTPTATDTEAPTEAPTNTPTTAETEEPTEAATAIAAVTDDPTEDPTEAVTATSPPTATPTEAATNTVEPTEADASATPTTGTSGSNRVRKVTLKYDDVQFVLINTGNIFVDISKMKFVQKRSSGQRTLDTTLWSAPGSQYQPYELPPNFCYQAYRNDRNEPQPFPECPIKPRNLRAAWARVAAQRWFWISDPNDPQETFDVLIGENAVASCEIQAGICEVQLP